MKSRVENYIPDALAAAKEIANNGEISNEFNGYISSFGASVIQSGLIPAVSFFSVQAGAQKERPKLMKAIYFILKSEENKNKSNGEENTELTKWKDINDNSLLEYILEYKDNQLYIDVLKDKIIDAAIALKLAIRTFKLIKNK